MLFKLFLLFVMAAWAVKKIWEWRWTRRTGRPANELWDAPPPGGWPVEAELRGLRKREDELDREIIRIEEQVGIGNDEAGSAASILEGLVEWEDFVSPGFERQKKQWFKLNEELQRVGQRIAYLEREQRPVIHGQHRESSLFSRHWGHPPAEKIEPHESEQAILCRETTEFKRAHPVRFFLVCGGMPGFAGVSPDFAARVRSALTSGVLRDYERRGANGK